MVQLYIHIGLHKTGTSAIQYYLNSKYKNLLDDGILYPIAGRSYKSSGLQLSHHFLAWQSVSEYANRGGREMTNEPWIALRKEVEEKKPMKAVISSEFFWRANRSEIDKIRSYLKAYNCKVIVYFRNPLDFALSSYKQGVKTGKITIPIREYIQNRFSHYDYFSITENWVSIFGRSNVYVKIYEKIKTDLIGDFKRTVGISDQIKSSDSDAHNISPTDSVVSFIRILNRLELKSPKNTRPLLKKIRRNIVQNRNPGVIVANLANFLIKTPIATKNDKDYFKDVTEEMTQRFLSTYVEVDDRRYFD